MAGWMLPLHRDRVLPDVLAGVTLAAPEVLGYARIAGMPVATGLYTLLVPMVVFALLCSSRHLVVGADSATAAILAAGLTGLAVPGSPRYVQLAGAAQVDQRQRTWCATLRARLPACGWVGFRLCLLLLTLSLDPQSRELPGSDCIAVNADGDVPVEG